MKKENFNFNTYYNYISYNKFNLYYLIDYLLYNLDIELNYNNNEMFKSLNYVFDNFKIYTVNDGEVREYTIKEILPYSFKF